MEARTMQPDQTPPGGPWRLDAENVRVWRGEEVQQLTPKAFALLRYLVEHPGRVLTKDELFEHLWPGTVVSDSVLSVYISELRKILGDTARVSHFIETVHRLGYRFIGPAPLPPPAAAAAPAWSPAPLLPPSPAAAPAPRLLIGRETELLHLQERLVRAQGGERQIVLIAGEAGSGKTTLMEALLARLTAEAPCWWVQGQCLDHFGVGEPYLPLLEALGRLGRGPEGARVVAVLSQHAPTWVIHIPALLAPAALEALHRRVLGATGERMVRELGEAVEVLTRDRLLVLVLEDLHWSDAATLDVLAWLAHRREPARLLLLGTYRPVEVIMDAHPLRGLVQRLTLHQQAVVRPLELLTAAEVAQYLTTRFGTPEVAAALAQEVHRRTSGNPLFMVTVVDALVQQGVLWQEAERWRVREDQTATGIGVPESLRQMIELLLDRLSEAAQRVLEAASVVGMVSSAAAVAAGVQDTLEAVEEQCASLARHGPFLEADGVEAWPNGTVAGRYRFRHTLYQDVLYERVTAPRRLRLHRQIGAALEAGYGPQARKYAAALADHFVRGRDDQRAAVYLRQAGENALRRWAYAEAIGYLSRGVAVLQRVPETPDRVQQELDIQLVLASSLLITKGHTAPEVGRAYRRAYELCEQLGVTPQRFEVLRGLRRFALGRGEVHTVRALAEQQLQLAQQSAEPLLLVEARLALGTAALYQGELAAAQAHLAQGITLYVARRPRVQGFTVGQDAGTACFVFMARTLWLLGYPEQAMQQAQKALSLSQALGYPSSLAFTLEQVALIHLLRREWLAVQECAQAISTIGTAQGFRLWQARATVYVGRALVAQGQIAPGLSQMQQGLAVIQATKEMSGRAIILSLLAEAYALDGQVEAGLALLAEALDIVHSRGLRFWEAEVYRLRGTLLLAQGSPGHTTTDKQAEEASTCFQQALALARQQQARAWELRAATSLARLWWQGRRVEAQQILREVYGWFSEGFETGDMQEARALLGDLG
jgi:predicted ATPase